MRILHISRYDNKAAGVIAYTLHQELMRRGHESHLLARDDFSGTDDGIIGMYSPLEWHLRRTVARIRHKLDANCPSILKRALGYCGKIDPDYCPQSLWERKNSVSSKALLKKFPFRPDVIIFFFIDGFLNAKNIYDIFRATGARILWFPPDMAAMTGGCHYTWDCEGYKNLCGRCPAILSDDHEDITRQNMLFKQKHLKNVDITILAGTEWIYRRALTSTLFKNRRIEHIMVPIDEEQFKPGDKADACCHFGISPGKKVIFFGARSLHETRKGIKYLLDSLKTLKDEVQDTWLQEKIHLLIAGGSIEEFANELAFDYTYVGLLSIEDELPKAFQAADLFACPSIEDSGPMMINQSIMSGTPVVAFETGVALDLVNTRKTGYRAALKNNSSFAKGMREILSLPEIELEKMKKNCRELGLTKGTATTQAGKIEDILMRE